MKREKVFEKNSKKVKVFLGLMASGACLCLFLLNSVHAKESDTARGLKVGIVDLSNVLEKYEKWKVFNAQIQEQGKQYQKTINDKKKELVSLNEKIQLLDLGSEARKKDEEAFDKKNLELESYAKFAERSMTRKTKDYFESLYTEICKEIESIGKREQYDLIIKKQEPELQSGGMPELQLQVAIKAVLYNSDALDITNKVIDNLNKKYSEASKGK